ncbi:MAG: DsbA family protein [Pseudomonadota bacterium]
MFRTPTMIMAATFLAITTFAVGPAAAQDERSVEEIEQIVRDYLLREPEIVYEAIQALQARQQAAESERRRASLVAFQEQIFEDPNDPVAGNPEGDVTLVEYFDYQCGYCRRMAPAMQALLEDDPNLRLVFKELPVLGPNSMVAARAAMALSRIAPEHYLSYHFALMHTSDLSEDTILAEAEELGVDADALMAEMESAPVAEAIQTNLQIAGELGINGTPSFVIGETIIPGAIPINQLTQLIEQQRQAALKVEG